MTRLPGADDPRTRRNFLAGTAAAAAVGLAGCSSNDGGNTAEMNESGGMDGGDEMGMENETESEEPEPMAAPDVPLLNYALTLEHLENAFYREGLETFADDELMGADVLSPFGERVRMEVPEYLRTVGAHEAAHVEQLTETVETLNGEPVGEGEYDFGYETPSEFLGVAQALENTGVAAYKGAAPSVSSDAVFSAAIGIHSVEARHAALLNEVNATSPFPAGVDEPQTMDEVVEVAGQFIVEE